MYDFTTIINDQEYGVMKKPEMYLVTRNNTFLGYIQKEGGNWVSDIHKNILDQLVLIINNKNT